ncbi:MAG: glycosyltransferase family 1 protein [bacterium]
MRIGFDARMINHSGIGTFINNFLELLPRTSNHEFVLFGDPALLCHYPYKVIPFNKRIYTVSEQIYWPVVSKRGGIQLLHLPHYNIPIFSGKKMIVHIHDIIHLLFPEYLPNKLAYYYAKYFFNRVVKKADFIITNSTQTREDIIRVLNANPSKIKVIYYAVSSEFQQYTDTVRNEKIYILEKYNLPKKYCLYVGNIRLIKNIPRLIKSFQKFQKKTGSEYHIVLAGNNFLPEWYIKANTSEKIHFIGKVAKEDLPAIYNFATLFLFPSLYEGFGLPVLEAMACGVPVICSEKGSLKEITGGAAIYIDEKNINGIAEAIEDLLENPQKRHELRKKGFERIKDFNWQSTAKEICEVYNQIEE